MSTQHTAFIGIGSNLGDREANLLKAIELLNQHPSIEFLKKSSWHENPAIEEAGPDDFLNGVLKVQTSLSPRELLDEILRIEQSVDPDRESRGRKKARYLDMDILSYGDLEIKEEGLEIPHPRMYQRSFVMKPLAEIEASDQIDAIQNKFNTDKVTNMPELPNFRNPLSEQTKTNLEAISKLINSNSLFNIRRMYLEDLDRVMEIDEEAFGAKHWSREIFTKELANEHALYMVAESKDTKLIIGIIGIWQILDEMHIMTLATDKAYQGKKVAETLLLAAFDSSLRSKVRNISLEVRLDNIAAQKLYEKYNFHRQGIRKNYYQDGEPALILWTENIQESEFQETLAKNLELIVLQKK